jgi:amino acid adenylation domain-containing protein
MSTVQLKKRGFDRKAKEERDYWVGKLSRELGPSGVPLDYSRAGGAAQRDGSDEITFPDDLTAKLDGVAGNSPLLLYTTLLTALKVCLHKYTGGNPIVVGSPARRRADGDDAPPNALAIADDIDERGSFKKLLLSVRENLVEAYGRQDYPFERVLRDLGVGRAEGRNSLFDVALALESLHGELPPLKNDLTLVFRRSEAGITGRALYDRGLFRPESIRRLLGHLVNVLRAALGNIEVLVRDLEVMSADERRTVLEEWNDTRRPFPRERCVHELFEEQTASAPEAIALVFEGRRLTYGELNRRANQLAHHLRRLGVGPESLVGLSVGRSPELVVGLLGVLKAGGVYVPMDPTYPRERLRLMLEDSGVKVLLAVRDSLAALPETEAAVLCLDSDWEAGARESAENPENTVAPDNAAYVIYTSGSTGRPKGVVVPHRGIGNLALAQSQALEVRPESRALQFASASFDASVSEIFMALVRGATLCLSTRGDLLSGQALVEFLREQQITTATLPPAILAVLGAEDLPALKSLIVAGESCPGDVATRWSADRLLFNAYGPTETTVCATMMRCEGAYTDSPPIGRPIENVQVYVLDAHSRPVPVGVEGELYVGGVGVARGYLGRPGLTAERFVPDPFSREPGARLYRTGDRALYLPDGNVEFLGRADNQVKVRGYRIELGEVEAALARHPGVREAVVVVREDVEGDKRLVAYLAAAGQLGPTTAELSAFVRESLPDYMVPSAFVTLEEFPLTPNGKVDRRALPAPHADRTESGGEYVTPRTPTEEVLAGIWSQVLGVARVGVTDNFFALGGHSLLATQVISRVRATFAAELPLTTLFDSPTVEAMARHVEADGVSVRSRPPVEPAPRGRELPLSYAQQRLWFLWQLEPDSTAYNVHLGLRLEGDLHVAALERALDEIVRRHEVLRTTFSSASGRPFQVINRHEPLHLPLVDLRGEQEEGREREARRLATAEAQRPFDLARGPLLRAGLLRLDEDDHVLLVTMHHIVSDGWSLGVLSREVTALYEAYTQGRPSPLAELPIQYADFAVWQREWLRGEALEAELEYWKGQLGDRPQATELPPTGRGASAPGSEGAAHLFALPAELTDSLQALSRREGVTLFMTLLAGFQVLLHRHTGQTDIVVGTDIANRNRGETEKLIGFFVNQVVLRADLSDDPTVRQLLGRARAAALGAYAHQDLPFEKLVHALRPERDLGRSPLFQAKLILQNALMTPLELPGLAVSAFGVDRIATPFDFVLALTEESGRLSGALTYNADLFEAASVARMMEHFRVVLEGMAADSSQRVSNLRLLTDSEAKGFSPADFPEAGLSRQDFEGLLMEISQA